MLYTAHVWEYLEEWRLKIDSKNEFLLKRNQISYVSEKL